MPAPTPSVTPRPGSLPSGEVTVVDLSAPASGVSPGLKYGILALTLLMPLIGIGLGLYFWHRRSSAEKVAVGKLWFFAGLGVMVLYLLFVTD